MATDTIEPPPDGFVLDADATPPPPDGFELDTAPQESTFKKVSKVVGKPFTKSGEFLSSLSKAAALLAVGEPGLAKKELAAYAQDQLPPEIQSALEKAGYSDESPYEEGRKSLPVVERAAAGLGPGLIGSAPQLAATMVAGPVGAATFGFTKEGFDPVQAATAMIAPMAGKFLGNVAAKVAAKARITSKQAMELIDRAGGAAGVAGIMSAPSIAQIASMEPGESRNQAIEDTAANALLMGVLGGAGERDEKPTAPKKAPKASTTPAPPPGFKVDNLAPAGQPETPPAPPEAPAAPAAAPPPPVSAPPEAKPAEPTPAQPAAPAEVEPPVPPMKTADERHAYKARLAELSDDELKAGQQQYLDAARKAFTAWQQNPADMAMFTRSAEYNVAATSHREILEDRAKLASEKPKEPAATAEKPDVTPTGSTPPPPPTVLAPEPPSPAPTPPLAPAPPVAPAPAAEPPKPNTPGAAADKFGKVEVKTSGSVSRVRYFDKSGNEIGYGQLDGDVINYVSVDPKYQRQGYGSEIVKDLKQRGGKIGVAGTPEGTALMRSKKVGANEYEPNKFNFEKPSPVAPASKEPAVQPNPGQPAPVLKPGNVDMTAEPPPTTTAFDSSKIVTQEIPIKGLKLSKDVPNFKGGASEETGTVPGQELSGKYERKGTAPIVVWERLNGDKEVITGRHRFDLAKRTKEKTIPAQIVREADGFTKDMALTFDAEANIRDGQGEINDYAHYFKNTFITEDEARARGLLSRAKGQAGWSLAKAASDDVYSLWQAGKLTDAQAVAIANAAPGDAAAQRIGSKFALQGKPADFITNLIKASKVEAGQRAQALDLFGSDDSAMQKMAEQAERAAQFQRDIRNRIQVLTAGKKSDIAKSENIDVKDPASIPARITQLKAESERWQNWPLHPDLVAKVRGVEPESKATPPVAPTVETKPATPKKSGELFGAEETPFNLAGEKQKFVEPTKTTTAHGDETLTQHDMFAIADITQEVDPFKSANAAERMYGGAAAAAKKLRNQLRVMDSDPAVKRSFTKEQRNRLAEVLNVLEQKQAGPGTGAGPGIVGMGGAIPAEFEAKQQTPTGIKNATVEKERAARGLPPAIEPARRSFGRVWDEAMAEVDQNPDAQRNLIDELRDHPRAITDREDALLLQKQIELQNDYGKLTQDLAQAADDAKNAPSPEAAESRAADAAELKNRVAGIRDQLFDLYEINKRVGTETGRGLNARKMMAYEDYSLAQMELGARAAKGGRPLTPDELEQVRQLHEKIDKLRKDYDAYVAESQNRIAQLEAEKALAEAAKTAEPPIEPHIQKIAEKIMAGIHSQAESARERIRARRKEGRLMTGLDPADLADHAIVGAEYLAKGIEDTAKWGLEMVKEFGDYVNPHLPQILAASKKALEKNFEGKTAPQDKPKAKRAAKTLTVGERQDRTEASIRQRIESGRRDEITPLVQNLARILVEQGVKDRNELIDTIHEFLQQIEPGITRRETMDAISGYGDFKQLSKDEVSIELRDLKGQMQQVAKLEDMQAGQPPLKTGLERRIPSPEESRLIKAVNEAKRKFQIPITDPNTQLKSALDTLKTRMQTRINELQKKLAAGDFAPRPQREPIRMDAKARALYTELERAKMEYERGLQLDRLKNRTMPEKIADTLVKWRRGFLLSSPITLAKLTSAAVQRLSITPAEEAIGGVISKALPKVAKQAKREGGFNSDAEAKAFTEAFTTGMKDGYDMLTKGASELDVLYGGGREGYVRENLALPKSVIDFFGHLHGALKAPTKRAEFARAMEKRTAAAVRDGVDVSDPMVQTKIAVDAYKDANRSIFLNDNRVTTAYKAAIRTLEMKDKATGKTPVGSKALATTAKVMLPIVRVPTNIVAETFVNAFGTVTGSAKLGQVLARGIDTLKPEEADMIMRHLKKGSLGAAVMLLGFLNPQLIGGYYVSGQKRQPDDVKIGSVKIYGHSIPSYLLHNPLLETLQLGATIRRVADSKLHPRDLQKQGVTAGLVAGAIGLGEEVPFVREMFGELPKVMRPTERAAFFGELLKSMTIPQVVQWLANYTDKDQKGETIARKPAGPLQYIESGIPGLREQVPKKNVMQE